MTLLTDIPELVAYVNDDSDIKTFFNNEWMPDHLMSSSSVFLLIRNVYRDW